MAVDPPPRPAAQYPSAVVLNELLSNTLDPGYQAAAEQGDRHRWGRPAVWAGCVIIGLILSVAFQQQQRSAPSRESVRRELVSRIRAVQSSGNALEATARSLAAQVAAGERQQLQGAGVRANSALSVAGGTEPMHGPGLTVSLGEAPAPATAGPARPGTVPQVQVSQITYGDLREVVNELWSAGAEAIEVNGIRLTATSFIRFAGESIVVDFADINSPYTIVAIGDRAKLAVGFADSAVARRLKTRQGVNGISFAFTQESDVHVNAVGPVQPNYAQRGAAPAPTATGSKPPR
jgi:uncharacterized protein YlxW (UPF0749 family)